MITVERIFKLIEKHNITAKELADATGLAKSNFTEWKNGRANPGYGALVKIAQYFNVTVDYLEGKTNKPNRIIIRDANGIEHGWADVIDEAKQSGLSPEEVRYLIELAKKINKKKP